MTGISRQLPAELTEHFAELHDYAEHMAGRPLEPQEIEELAAFILAEVE